ncbi:MAG: hypothetical protein JO247_02315 [Chloroflexi bacterium]|nr:hypothetical protein [Chloroflexota bacterium]
MSARIEAAEAYVQALKTGEGSATKKASEYLAEDVVLNTGREEVKGYNEVLKRITGQWPQTPTMIHAGWGFAEDGDKVTVAADFPPLGAAPQAINLTLSFNGSNKITRIDQETKMAGPQPPTNKIPDFIKGNVNAALANGTPMVVAYTGPDGQPVLSLRGSTQVFSDTALCIWLRNAEGGLYNAARSTDNNRISLLYRDSKTRTTLIFQGRGRIADDEPTRRRVYDISPEVEQNHDPARKGAALIIDIDKLQATTPRGMIRMQREG